MASSQFEITALRFATACGWSPRIRLDLVLNDFVASALAKNKIEILSDGSPWRPLIHVEDMAQAVEWAINREIGPNFLAINVGCDKWNYRISDLAYSVSKKIKNTEVIFNKNAEPDKRSYQVDFKKYLKYAPNHQPKITLSSAINGLYDGLTDYNFFEKDFRKSNYFIRLNTLSDHCKKRRLNNNLEWLE